MKQDIGTQQRGETWHWESPGYIWPAFQTEEDWGQPTLGGGRVDQGLREAVKPRIQEKGVSRRRKIIRMGAQRWVPAWLYLNLLCVLGKATCLSAPQRSQLKCYFLRAAFSGHPP